MIHFKYRKSDKISYLIALSIQVSGLKYSFYYYSVVRRPAGQETAAMEKVFVIITEPKRLGHATPQGPHPELQGWSRGRGSGGKAVAGAFVVVSVRRKRQDSKSRFRMANFNNFSRLGGLGAVPRLVPGPE